MNNTLILGFFTGINEAVNNFFTGLIIAAIVIRCVILFIKYEAFRYVFGTFMSVVLVGSAVFSGFKLNKYYNTSGGIIGELTTIFNPNKVDSSVKDTDINFDFSNVMLTQYEDTTYRAEFITQNVISLDTDERYAIFVNDTPCEILEYSEDYILGDYHYAFIAEDFSVKLKDTLSFRFAFYESSSKLIVSTTGGENAVDLWNSYFQKNDFIVSIKQVGNAYISESSLVDIELYTGDEVYKKVTIKKGSDYILPTNVEVEGYRFNYWTLNNEKIENLENILEDTKIYADLSEIYQVNFYLTKNVSNSTFIDQVEIVDGELVQIITCPEREYYTFLGWSLDGENVYDFKNYVITEDTNIYAVWQAEEISLIIELNGGSMSLEDTTYTEDFTQNILFDETIILSKPTKDGCYFTHYLVKNYTEDSYSCNVSDTNFNLSVKDIFEMLYGSVLDEKDAPEYKIDTLVISAQYMPTSDNIDYWSDDDLKQKIEILLGMGINESGYYVYEPVSNEEWIDKLYESLYGIDADNKTLYEKERYITDTLAGVGKFEGNYDETITTREFLELLYENLG